MFSQEFDALKSTEAYGFTFSYPSGDTVVGPCLDRYGEFARITSTLAATTSRGGTFIDVGANIGAVALPVSRFARHVIAIEAHPDLAGILQKNVSDNDIENILVIPAAAGSSSSRVDFPAIPLNSIANFGSGGLKTDSKMISVPGIRLDDIASADTLAIKIDVEGMEPDVISGSNAILEELKPAIIVEFNTPTILDQLRNARYRTYWLWEPFVTPLAPKAKWTSRFRGDLSVFARHENSPQPMEMIEAFPGDSPPTSTKGFAYLQRFGIRERSSD